MPCHSEDWRPDPRIDQAEDNKHMYGVANDDISMLTGFLCEACNLLNKAKVEDQVSSELKRWIKRHRKLDEIRRRT